MYNNAYELRLKMNEVKAYKLTVENVELFEEIEHEVLFQTTIKTKKSILNYLTPVST